MGRLVEDSYNGISILDRMTKS